MMQVNAIVIAQGGLAAAKVNLPEPGAGQILISVHYAGINRADVLQVEGKYPAPEETQMVPGMEVSGVVEKVGAGVAHLKAGDPVAALMGGGGYAQYALAEASQCFKIDKEELESAAALPEALVTNWIALREKAQVMKEIGRAHV